MRKRVFIDPGHGGKDKGEKFKSRTEANDVLKIARLLRDYFETHYDGVDVKMSRSQDVYKSNKTRIADSNQWHADLFISLHRSHATPSVCGYETIVYTQAGISGKISEKINYGLSELGFADLGVKTRTGVEELCDTEAPAILCNLGYISNKKDNEILDQKRGAIARVIARSVADALGLKEQHYGIGMLTNRSTKLFESNSEDSNVLVRIPKGKRVYVLAVGTKHYWCRARYDGKVGYVLYESLG